MEAAPPLVSQGGIDERAAHQDCRRVLPAFRLLFPACQGGVTASELLPELWK